MSVDDIMGSFPSTPDFKVRFTSSCCNVEDKNYEIDKDDKRIRKDLVRSPGSSRIWRAIQAFKGKRQFAEENQTVVEGTDGIHIEQTTEDPFPDKTL